MAFVEVGSTKTNSPFRTDPGEGWSDLPATGNTEVKATLPSCAGCSKLASHNPCALIGFKVPQGETSWEDVPSGNRITHTEFRRVFQALWQLDYIFHGWIGSEIIFNAGDGGDNATQFKDYEIVSVSGATLTLKGDNPKRLTLGRSIPNPDWPLTPGALQTVQEYFALRPGAGVEFLAPSVLAGKIKPYIESISPPASNAEGGVTFSVTLSANVSFARSPFDAAFPPGDGKYYCRVWFTQFHDAGWPNVQEPVEALFSPRTQTITRAAAVTASGLPELLDTAGDPTRVIPPGVDPVTTPVLTVLDPGGDFEAPIADRIVTTQNGHLDWTTTINVVDLLAAYATATGFEVSFFAESVAADSERAPHRGCCGNCQIEPTGSYAHHSGSRCTAVDCDQFATFKASCWQPNASRFNLAGAGGSFRSGNAVNPAADIRDGNLWARAWTGASWMIRQGVPGASSSSNFSLVRMGIPGLQEFLGAWAGGVPGGNFASQTPFFSPALGRDVWSVDGDGNDVVTTEVGAFFLQSEWDASTAPDAGLLPDTVTWTGAATSGVLENYPAWRTGRTSVYNWDTSASSEALTNRKVTQEVFITGVSASTEDATAGPRLRARVGGL